MSGSGHPRICRDRRKKRRPTHFDLKYNPFFPKEGMPMKVRYGIVAFVLGLLPMTARAQEEVKITGRVLDAAGKPVAGAEVASFWIVQKGTMTSHQGATTNGEGQFTVPLTFYGRGQALLAVDKDRKTGGLIVVE